jgi:hypothetical protein
MLGSSTVCEHPASGTGGIEADRFYALSLRAAGVPAGVRLFLRRPSAEKPTRLVGSRLNRGTTCSVDERVSQFFVSVGRLCADAHIGRLTVRLTLVSGAEIVGVPDPPPETEGSGELDATGYADGVTVAGVAVALSDVIEASVGHPGAVVDGT